MSVPTARVQPCANGEAAVCGAKTPTNPQKAPGEADVVPGLCRGRTACFAGCGGGVSVYRPDHPPAPRLPLFPSHP